MPQPRMQLGLVGLLSLCVGGCREHPASPTDFHQLTPTVSSPGSVPGVLGGSGGCTFGSGYWKTHPDAWPGRFDPNAVFFTSGKSWIDVLNTPPRGEAYYILGHQFIAAGLNLERLDSDLRPREIGEPWAIAGSGYFTEGAHSSFTRTELTDLATLFQNFNEGKRGVPPCP